MGKRVKREEAKRIILEHARELGTEVVTIEEATGRVLAEDIISQEDIPSCATSAMDGYAVKVNPEAPQKEFRIIGRILAGDTPSFTLKENEACYVATGAFLPQGANAVVRVEDAEVEGDILKPRTPPRTGDYINPPASEIRCGERVLPRGEELDYRKVGLLARLGIYQVRVFSRPRVAIVATGSEIREPFCTDKGAIRNVNSIILKSMLKRYTQVSYMGIVEDNPEGIAETLNMCLERYDAVVTTGGVSVGKADYIKKALSMIEVDVKFEYTNIKPGRPLCFGTKNGKLFFGLPGYPSAMLVNALEFLVPALRKMQGYSKPDNTYFKVIAGEDFKSRKGKVYFIRANFKHENGRIIAYSAGSQLTSNYLTSAICQGFVIVEAEREIARKGEILEALRVANPS